MLPMTAMDQMRVSDDEQIRKLAKLFDDTDMLAKQLEKLSKHRFEEPNSELSKFVNAGRNREKILSVANLQGMDSVVDDCHRWAIDHTIRTLRQMLLEARQSVQKLFAADKDNRPDLSGTFALTKPPAFAILVFSNELPAIQMRVEAALRPHDGRDLQHSKNSDSIRSSFNCLRELVAGCRQGDFRSVYETELPFWTFREIPSLFGVSRLVGSDEERAVAQLRESFQHIQALSQKFRPGQFTINLRDYANRSDFVSYDIERRRYEELLLDGYAGLLSVQEIEPNVRAALDSLEERLVACLKEDYEDDSWGKDIPRKINILADFNFLVTARGLLKKGLNTPSGFNRACRSDLQSFANTLYREGGVESRYPNMTKA